MDQAQKHQELAKNQQRLVKTILQTQESVVRELSAIWSWLGV